MIKMKYKYLKTKTESHWIGSPSITPEKYIGFVYKIKRKSDKNYYIGITRFWEKYKLPALKGKTNKRIYLKETNWRTYTSSGIWKEDIEKNPNKYKFEIIRKCETKTELKAYEAYLVLEGYFKGDEKMINEMVEIKLRLRKIDLTGIKRNKLEGLQ